MARKRSILPVVSIVFDRKRETQKNPESLGLVQVRVSMGAKRSYVTTDVKVMAKDWDAKGLRVKYRSDAYGLNKRIENVVSIIRRYVDKYEATGTPFDWDLFEEHRNSLSDTNSKSFYDFAEERIQNRKDLSPGTRRHHLCTLSIIRDLGLFPSFEKLTMSEVKKFDDALRERGISQTTIYGHHKRVRLYIKEAILLGTYNGDNPYTKFRLDKGESKPREFLTEEELDVLRNFPIEGSLKKVRDLFLFQCFTGLSYADMSKFNFATDLREIDGRFEIRDTRQKTSIEYYIVLLSPAVKILRSYDWVLPLMSIEQYNMRLKVVAEHAGIKHKLSSHMARHTFACFALKHGVKIENLSKMLGHTNIRTTQIYARVLNSSVREEYEKLESFL